MPQSPGGIRAQNHGKWAWMGRSDERGEVRYAGSAGRSAGSGNIRHGEAKYAVPRVARMTRSGTRGKFPDPAIECLSHLLEVLMVFLGEVLAFRLQGGPVGFPRL